MGAKEDDRAGLPCGRFRHPTEQEMSAGNHLVNKFVRVCKDKKELVGSQKSREKAVREAQNGDGDVNNLSEDVIAEDGEHIWYAARVSDYNVESGKHKLAYLLDDTLKEEDLSQHTWQVLEETHLGPTTAMEDANENALQPAAVPRRRNKEDIEREKKEYEQQLEEEEAAAADEAKERRERAKKLLEKTQKAWEKKIEHQELRSRRREKEIARKLRETFEKSSQSPQPEKSSKDSKADIRQKMESFLQQESDADHKEEFRRFWGESAVLNFSSSTDQADHSTKRSRSVEKREESNRRKKRKLRHSKLPFVREVRNHAGEVSLRSEQGFTFPFELSWRFPLDKVVSPPCRQADWSADMEYLWRYHVQLIIARTSSHLDSSFRAVSRALLISNRFCSLCTMRNVPIRAVASACLIIAHKLELQMEQKQKLSISRVSRRVAKTSKEMIEASSPENNFSTDHADSCCVPQALFGYCCGILYDNQFASADEFRKSSEKTSVSSTDMDSSSFFFTECLHAKHAERVILSTLRFSVDQVDIEGVLEALEEKCLPDLTTEKGVGKDKIKEILSAHPWLKEVAKTRNHSSPGAHWKALTQLITVFALVSRHWLWSLHVPEAVVCTIGLATVCYAGAYKDPESPDGLEAFGITLKRKYLCTQAVGKHPQHSPLEVSITAQDIWFLCPFLTHRFGSNFGSISTSIARLANPNASLENIEKDLDCRTTEITNMSNASKTSTPTKDFEFVPLDLREQEIRKYRHDLPMASPLDERSKLRTIRDFEFIGQVSSSCFVAIDHGLHLKEPRLIFLKKWPEYGCELPPETAEEAQDQKLYGFSPSAFRELSFFRMLHCPWRDTNPKEELLQSTYAGISREIATPVRTKVCKNVIVPVEVIVGESYLASLDQIIGSDSNHVVNTTDQAENLANVSSIDGMLKFPEEKLRQENYLVMEYFPHNLNGFTTVGAKVSPSYQQKFASGFLKAIRALHSRNIVHQVINSNHLLCNASGEVCLYGLGDAKPFDSSHSDNAQRTLSKKPSKVDETELQSLIGSCRVDASRKVGSAYMCKPPESLLGCSLYLPSSDMWSAGCVLAEMFLGESLFKGSSTVKDLIRRIGRLCGDWERMWPICKKLPYSNLVKSDKLPVESLKAQLMNKGLPESQAKLVSHLLQINPGKRVSADSALKMSYFKKHTPNLADRSFTLSSKYELDDLVDDSVDEPVEGAEFACIVPLRSYEMRLRDMQKQSLLGKDCWKNIMQHLNTTQTSASGQDASHSTERNDEEDNHESDTTTSSRRHHQTSDTPSKAQQTGDSQDHVEDALNSSATSEDANPYQAHSTGTPVSNRSTEKRNLSRDCDVPMS